MSLLGTATKQRVCERIADWEGLVYSVVTCSAQISEGLIITCSYELHVFSKTKYQSKPFV
jgi:hypothetical protein